MIHLRIEENGLTIEERKCCEEIRILSKHFLDGQGEIAICDSQRDVDEFLRHGIPVLGFERAGFNHLTGISYIVTDLSAVTMTFLIHVHHRFYGIPLEILETERTIVREFGLGDLDALYRLYEKPHMTDFVEGLYPYEEEADYQRRYIREVYGYYEYGMWLVLDKESGEVIGRAGIESKNDGILPGVELGYMIDPIFQGRGIAYEVCEAILEFARDEFAIREFYCRIHPDNVASIRLANKLGFHRLFHRIDQNGEELYILSLE